MGIFDLFRKKRDADLDYQKEFFVKAAEEFARRQGSDIKELGGFLCPRCYEKQMIQKSDISKMRGGKDMRCSKCSESMMRVF